MASRSTLGVSTGPSLVNSSDKAQETNWSGAKRVRGVKVLPLLGMQKKQKRAKPTGMFRISKRY
jgi:hypothetical protein